MKALKQIVFNSLIIILATVGCSKDSIKSDGEWIQINPSEPDVQTAAQLDLIFSRENSCLLNFQEDTVFHVISSHSDFGELNNLNTILEIDFDNYTLIAGKITVPSISDRISEITLTSSNTMSRYKLEISIDRCVECYWAIGNLYFWRLYPKLNAGYKINFSVTDK
jgi:hypothetical protein